MAIQNTDSFTKFLLERLLLIATVLGVVVLALLIWFKGGFTLKLSIEDITLSAYLFALCTLLWLWHKKDAQKDTENEDISLLIFNNLSATHRFNNLANSMTEDQIVAFIEEVNAKVRKDREAEIEPIFGCEFGKIVSSRKNFWKHPILYLQVKSNKYYKKLNIKMFRKLKYGGTVKSVAEDLTFYYSQNHFMNGIKLVTLFATIFMTGGIMYAFTMDFVQAGITTAMSLVTVAVSILIARVSGRSRAMVLLNIKNSISYQMEDYKHIPHPIDVIAVTQRVKNSKIVDGRMRQPDLPTPPSLPTRV